MKPVVSCFAFLAFAAVLALSSGASAIQLGMSVLDAGGKRVPAAKMGTVQAHDPLDLLAAEVKADIATLALRKPRTPAEEDAMDDLKDFLALTSGVMARPHTRKEADAIAATLRQFLLRHDIIGALAWVRAR